MRLPDDEWRAMQACLDKLPHRPLVVEIGCFEGGTTQKIAEYIWPRDGRIIAVDPHQGNTGWVETHKSLNGFMKGAGQMENVIPILGTSLTASKMRLKPDFVFIDGDHSYEGCQLDCRLWSKTTPVIAFHDTLDKPVWKAIQEEILSDKTWHCEQTNSLLVCTKKKRSPLTIIKLKTKRAYYLLRRKLWKLKTQQTKNPILKKSASKSTPAESSKSQQQDSSPAKTTTTSPAHTSTKPENASPTETSSQQKKADFTRTHNTKTQSSPQQNTQRGKQKNEPFAF